MERTTTRWVLIIATLMATMMPWITGCNESGEAPETWSPPPDLLRLDGDLLPTLQAMPLAAPPPTVVRASWPDAAAGSPLPWLSVISPTPGALHFVPAPAQARLPVQVEGIDTTIALLDVAVGEVLQLSFTFSGASPPLSTEALPVGWLELTTPIDPGQKLSGPRARRLMTETMERSVLVPLVEQQGSTLRFSSWLTVAESTRQLALIMPRLETGLRLEQMLIERRSMPELLEAAADDPALLTHEQEASDRHNRVAVTLDREQRRALRLLPDSVMSWTLPEHRRPYRFEASLGLAPRDPALGGALQISLIADGLKLIELNETGSGDVDTPAWTALSCTVPQGTRRLTLLARWPTGDGPLAVLAHPRLRRAPQQPRQNLLIVSLDTLRADRLGCYGGSAPSAHIDAFAAAALRFATAYSTSSYTLPSHASLLSGQLPLLHGARRTRDHLDGAHTPLLTSLLADAGWVTAAFTGGGFLSTAYGFGTGFDRFSHNDPGWPIDTLRGRLLVGLSPSSESHEFELLRRFDVGHIVDWLGAQPQGAPFFALVHTYATHNYAPSRRWLEQAGLLTEDGEERLLDRSDYHAWKAGALELRQAVTDEFTSFYDATIGSADDFVGALLAGLDQAGLADQTIVVLLSDHGEELGELDVFGHGKTLHEGVTRVPLMVRIPGRPAQVIDPAISLADLAPWLLDLLDVPVDPAMIPPPALAPDHNDPPGRTTTLLDLATGDIDQWAVRSGSFKLLQRGEGTETRLFDLSSKEGERREVSEQYPGVRRRLERILQAYRNLEGFARNNPPQELDRETRRKLEQLGYLQGDG